MDLDSLQRIGRFGKPWGHQGHLTVHLDGCEVDELQGARALFADIDGQKVPFFPTELREKGRDVLVKFDDLHDPQAAAFLVGRDLFAPPGHFGEPMGEAWDTEEFVGLAVQDERHGDLGTVTAIDGTPANPVLVVHKGPQEVLVPLAEDLIVDLDMEARRLVIRTPEGLVDLYLRS